MHLPPEIFELMESMVNGQISRPWLEKNHYTVWNQSQNLEQVAIHC
jgi:hypothetical protein